MISEDAELTPYGERMLDVNQEVCQFCERSMISRFGGLVGTHECESCSADFRRYYEAHDGMIEVG